MPKLKNWLFANGMGLVVEPKIIEGNEVERTRLLGYIFDDKRYNPNHLLGGGEFEDGHRVITSPVEEINLEEGYVITRSGTKYEFDGPANSDYEEWLALEEGDRIDVSAWSILPRLPN